VKSPEEVAAADLCRRCRYKEIEVRWSGVGFGRSVVRVLEHRLGMLVAVEDGVLFYYGRDDRDVLVERHGGRESGGIRAFYPLSREDYDAVVDAAAKAFPAVPRGVRPTKRLRVASTRPESSRLAVVLTAWIDPENEGARVDLYRDVVLWWGSKYPGLDLFLVDSSGSAAAAELKALEGRLPRLSVITFDQGDFHVRNGKGACEFASLCMASKEATLIGRPFANYAFVFKLTGRYKIPNFMDLVVGTVDKNPDVDFVVSSLQRPVSSRPARNTEILGVRGCRFDASLSALRKGTGKLTCFERRLHEFLPQTTYAVLPALPLDAPTRRGGDNLRMDHV